MDEFFQYYFSTPSLRISNTAFIPYNNHRTDPISSSAGGRNVHWRMIEFLRRSWSSPEVRERGYKHMINERLRREKQKQCYSILRSLLPHGTKNDKNTIVQVAAKEIVELEKRRQELENENKEMSARLAKEEVGLKKITLKVGNPCSGVHSILEVLKCLKSKGFKTKSIQSTFSNHEVSAVLQILLQDKEYEEAQVLVRETLTQVEKSFTRTFPKESAKFGNSKEP